MVPENHIVRGILLEEILRVSKVCPLRFDNGQIIVGSTVLGSPFEDYSTDLLEEVVIQAIREGSKEANKRS